LSSTQVVKIAWLRKNFRKVYRIPESGWTQTFSLAADQQLSAQIRPSRELDRKRNEMEIFYSIFFTIL
jgi:hypothetical protein